MPLLFALLTLYSYFVSGGLFWTEFSWYNTSRVIEHVLFEINLSAILWFFNSLGQKITDQVTKLKTTLKSTYFDSGILTEYKGQIVPLAFKQRCIVDKLGEFKGFDGQKYFYLGKSYMTNFVTFFITI